LEVERARRARRAHAFGRVAVRAVRIAAHRNLALARFEPRRFGRVRERLEQAPRALQPTVRDGRLAAKRRAIPRDPDGHPRGAPPIAAIDIALVRTFSRVEEAGFLVEPPAREAEP